MRLQGYGHPTTFLVKATDATVNYQVRDNDAYGLNFFPPALNRVSEPITLQHPKPKNTVRIFVLGGSAALGDPQPAFGMVEMMSAIFVQVMPSNNIEVINAAMTAINSHVLVDIAQSCAKYEPDWFVVYAGNNEVIGPFGPANPFHSMGVSKRIRSLRYHVIHLKMYQALKSVSRLNGDSGDQLAHWRGMEMFLDERLQGDDPRLQKVYRQFRENLSTLSQIAERAGARTLLCTVPVNVKDHAPFGSEPAVQNLSSMQADYESLVAEEGLLRVQEWMEQERSATLAFEFGQWLKQRGQVKASSICFRRALELDVLRFRADQGIQQSIRQVAEDEENVVLLDLERTFHAKGMTGRDWFLDHVHFAPNGNAQVAQLIVRTLMELEGIPPETVAIEKVLSGIGFDDEAQVVLMKEMIRRYAEPPFTFQRTHARDLRRFYQKLFRARIKLNKAEPLIMPPESSSIYLRRRMAAQELVNGTEEKGLQLFEKNAEQLPHRIDEQLLLAQAYASVNRLDEAQWALTKTYRSFHTPPHAMFKLASRLRDESAVDAARHFLKKALLEDPRNPDYQLSMSRLALERHDYEEALIHAENVLSVDSNRVDGIIQKGVVLAEAGRWGDALLLLESGVEKNPSSAQAAYYWGIANLKKGQKVEARALLEKTTLLKPDDADAWFELGRLHASAQRYREAAHCFSTVLNWKPEFVPASELLVQAYTMLHQPERGLARVEQVLRLVEDPSVLNNLVAWHRAVHADERVRDPDKAIRLANAAVQHSGQHHGVENPALLDTLAAAFAAAGQYSEAVRIGKKAYALAREQGVDEAVLKELSARILLYVKEKPYIHRY